ncbi:MAG TPA: hypothetical protein VFD86_09855 [Nitrospira sp.]|jgi:hypothetical protein|nr:hypothetical protein [Nitrospira sp.]
MRTLILSASIIMITATAPLSLGAELPTIDQKKLDPLQLPFGVEPSARSLESSQRLKEELRDQDLRVDTDGNRRMFRPKQPEPGYSEVRPYSGADTPTRVRPLRPIP